MRKKLGRSEILTLRVTPQCKEILERLAEKQRTTITAVLEEMILAHAPTVFAQHRFERAEIMYGNAPPRFIYMCPDCKEVLWQVEAASELYYTIGRCPAQKEETT